MQANSKFQQYLMGFESTQEILPLIHYTNSGNFRTIVENNLLKAQSCPNFNEDLLYFFYGRPAYRELSSPITDDTYNPICLLFKPQSINIKRAFPFDSGAFFKGTFAEHINEMTIERFLLKCSIIELTKVVSAFFGNNHDYYFGNFLKNKEFEYYDFEAKSFYSIISESGKTAHDDRSYTIEIQTKSIKLRNKIEAIVLPFAAYTEKIKNLVEKKWNAEVFFYETYRGSRLEEYNGVIRDIIRVYFEERGYFNV